MFFCGHYETIVDDNGEFFIPESFQDDMEAGLKCDIFYYPCEWDEGMLYISFVFKNVDHYYDATFISSGYVTADKKLKVPDSFIEFLKGDCEIIGNNGSLELSKVPVEMLLGDLGDLDILKELDVSF